MTSTIRVAQLKVLAGKGALEANAATLKSCLQALAGERVDVVVTPECFLDGYVATDARVSAADLRAYAIDPARSPLVRDVSAWARAQACWVILGCSRLGEAGVYNSALVVDRAGRLRGVHDKIHCQAHDQKYQPGDHLRTFDSDFGPFGVVICADRRWPETIRSLALQGARIVFNPTHGMHGDLNRCMMRTRSYESEVYVAFTHPEQALLTGPGGEIVVDEERPEIRHVVSTVDLTLVDGVRAGDTAHLRDRRTDLYGEPGQARLSSFASGTGA
ncbi:MAG: carbon-nitrogen hydrolase family protein [Lentisphaerae bacterium]|nr:carbon-nitrogen hydrolase family protein [Lentisphaerota bacterium]